MPISAAGNRAEHGFGFGRRSAEHGFTLIELMIVITIIGLASAAVVLAMPDPRGRLIDEAERFAARTRAAQDAAIIDARPMSMWVSDGGYGFDTHLRGAWRPIGEKPFQVARWSKGTRAVIADAQGRDRVMFDSTGLADRAIDVRLTRDSETTLVRIAADGTVRVGG